MAFDRRNFVKYLSASFAAPAVTSALPPLAGNAQTRNSAGDKRRSPNVIFMICDDLGYGDLGCYGSKLPTPHLNAMAADGLRFTRYNSAHPICSASRAAVLTGRYGLRCNTTGAFGPSTKTGTSLDETLLSNLFHDRGYKAKAIGKWHLGHEPAYLPTSRGFDSYYGVPYSVDMKPLPLMRDKTILEQDTDRNLLTVRYTEEAVKYLNETSADNPFFMYLAFSYPHDPARASARFLGKTRFGDSGDAIAEIDWSVGEVMAAVERRGLTSDTLIFFTSDHGPWYQGCPGLLRGRKATTFEGGFRVPLIVKWPGKIAPGRVTNSWYSSLTFSRPCLRCAICRTRPSRWTALTSRRCSAAMKSHRHASRCSIFLPWAITDWIYIAFAISNGNYASRKGLKARFILMTAPPLRNPAPGCGALSSMISWRIRPRVTT